MTALEALNLASPIAETYISVERRLLLSIARQLSLNDNHEMNEVSKWQIKQLAQLGMLRKDAAKIIADSTKDVPDNFADVVLQAITSALAEDGLTDMWQSESFAESAKNAVKHYRNQAKDVYNQVNTVMKYKAESSFVNAVNSVAGKWSTEMRRKQSEIADKQSFIDILDSNTASVVSGIESRTKAVRTTIHEMAEKGIPAFIDSAGREWSPEAYVNMDIRATVKNTALDTTFSVMDDLGQDVFEVSSHPGSRPKCRPWQGKLISRSGKTTEITDLRGKKHKVIPLSETSFGEPDGLFGINCGHRPKGISDGLFRKSDTAYNDAEDKELYNKVCKQRELERRVRRSKTEADMLEAAGDIEGAKEVRRKMSQQNKVLKDYCEDNGLKYRTGRVRTYGKAKPDKDRMSAINNNWTGANPTIHTKSELAELNKYATGKGIKLYNRKPFDGDSELLKAQIDTVAELRKEFSITDPIQIGWKRMNSNDFAETSANHQQIWFNEVALRNRTVTEKNLSADTWLVAGSAEGIAAHEMGHIISGKIKNGKTGIDLFIETRYNVDGINISVGQARYELENYISEYAAEQTFGTKIAYNEVIPEFVSMHVTVPNEWSKEFIRLLKEAIQ